METEYYEIHWTEPKSRGFDWIAYAAIIRKDTGEAVLHLSESGSSASEAYEHLKGTVNSAITSLSRPSDWGRDPTLPRLIQEYLAAKEQILNEAMNRAQSKGGERFDEEYTKLENEMRADFIGRVSLLSEDQQVALMTLTDRERENPDDIWVMDEIIARFWLYSLIQNPSPEARLAHDALKSYEAARLASVTGNSRATDERMATNDNEEGR